MKPADSRSERSRADDGVAPVEVRGLTKTFHRSGGDLVNAVDMVDLTVQRGEIVVLLGPSGCGKTTLLRCIAGLEEPSAGTIRIAGHTAYDAATKTFVPPNRRDVNMMFQSYALWPHMTLEDNVGYPLRIGGMRRADARRQANEYLDLVGLHGLGHQYGANVSGGQQQRAALARTLVSRPAVVLFDEPLSNVDAKVRSQVRAELLRLHAELDFAAVYVTHDQGEAMALGTKLAVMRDGRVDQFAPPVDVYNNPRTDYVARFVGAANVYDATISGPAGPGTVVESALGQVTVAGSPPATDEPLRIMFRPENCQITTDSHPPQAANQWSAVVESTVYSGAHTEYSCRVGTEELVVWRVDPHPIAAGARVLITVPAEAIRFVSG